MSEKSVKLVYPFQGLKISIENPAGDTRHWYDPNADEHGETTMVYDYGFINGTLGLDGDEVDCYIGPDKESKKVFVITQLKRFEFTDVDEQKCMLGFPNSIAAKTAYLQHFNDARFFGDMKEMTIEEFKQKLKDKYGSLIKHVLLDEEQSAKISGNNSLFLSWAKSEFKPSRLGSDSDVGSKVKFTVKSKENETTEDSISTLSDITKALRAISIAGLARRDRLNVAYMAGYAASQQTPQSAPGVPEYKQVDIGIDESQQRSWDEPPQLPVRKIGVVFPEGQKWEENKATEKSYGPEEAKPIWRR